MFGKLAKTDSHVSQEEIAAIESIMTNAKFDQETREEAIEFFNEGKTTKTPFREIAVEYAQYTEDVEMRRDALACLVQIATADGALHAREERYLNEAVAAFGLPPNVLAEALEEMLPDMQQYYAIYSPLSASSPGWARTCKRTSASAAVFISISALDCSRSRAIKASMAWVAACCLSRVPMLL